MYVYIYIYIRIHTYIHTYIYIYIYICIIAPRAPAREATRRPSPPRTGADSGWLEEKTRGTIDFHSTQSGGGEQSLLLYVYIYIYI